MDIVCNRYIGSNLAFVDHYSVVTLPYGILFFGKGIPVSHLMGLTKILGPDAIIAQGVSNFYEECILAIATSTEDLETWISEINAALEKQMDPLMQWYHGTDTGLSSKCLFNMLVHGASSKKIDIPHDSSDLGRCIRMVNKLGLRGKLETAKSLSPEWNQFIVQWDILEQLYDTDKRACTQAITDIIAGFKNDRK